MKYIFLLLFVFLLTLNSCDKDDNNEKLEEFLLMDNLPLNELTGSWDWINSNGWGPSQSPETEGYEKTITFGKDRIYREYIDSELSFETYLYRHYQVGHRKSLQKLFLCSRLANYSFRF